MNFKQKLGYTAFGAVILFVGMLSVTSLTPLTARNDTFDEIICRSLKVVDTDGRMTAHLKTGADDDGSHGVLKLMGNKGANAILLEPRIFAFVHNNKVAVTLSIDSSDFIKNARELKFYKPDGRNTCFYIVGSPTGGQIGITEADGKKHIFPSWKD